MNEYVYLLAPFRQSLQRR